MTKQFYYFWGIPSQQRRQWRYFAECWFGGNFTTVFLETLCTVYTANA
jgi:hypothetical protein